MPWILLLIVLALPCPAAGERSDLGIGDVPSALTVTYREGVVFVDRDGVRAQSGRAEAILGDGSLLHLDVDTTVRVAPGGALILSNGRAIIRTTAAVPLHVNVAWTQLLLAPGGEYGLMMDVIRDRLLVSVTSGRADVRAPGGAISLWPRQAAMLLGRGSLPVVTAFTAAGDSFGVWSASRPVRLGAGPVDAPRAGILETERAVYHGYSGYLSYDNPCRLLPVPRHRPWPHAPRSRPGYAPDYTPDYMLKPGLFYEPGAGARDGRSHARPPRGASRHQESLAPRQRTREESQAPAPVPAARPPARGVSRGLAPSRLRAAPPSTAPQSAPARPPAP